MLQIRQYLFLFINSSQEFSASRNKCSRTFTPNRPFPNCLLPLCEIKTRVRAKTTNSYENENNTCKFTNQTHLHIRSFTRGLVFKPRQKATRKWRIVVIFNIFSFSLSKSRSSKLFISFEEERVFTNKYTLYWQALIEVILAVSIPESCSWRLFKTFSLAVFVRRKLTCKSETRIAGINQSRSGQDQGHERPCNRGQKNMQVQIKKKWATVIVVISIRAYRFIRPNVLHTLHV